MNEKLKRVISSKSFWLGLVMAGSAVAGSLGFNALDAETQDRVATIISGAFSLFGI